MIVRARSYAAGDANARALVLTHALSFWGGVDPITGRVIDRSHPACGECVAGRVLVMPGGRGSSSSSSVLAEALRRGTGPAGIVLASSDPILIVGALVARFLYGIRCPIVVCDTEGISSGMRVRISAPEGEHGAEVEAQS